jgi:hypothetical protein
MEWHYPFLFPGCIAPWSSPFPVLPSFLGEGMDRRCGVKAKWRTKKNETARYRMSKTNAGQVPRYPLRHSKSPHRQVKRTAGGTPDAKEILLFEVRPWIKRRPDGTGKVKQLLLLLLLKGRDCGSAREIHLSDPRSLTPNAFVQTTTVRDTFVHPWEIRPLQSIFAATRCLQGTRHATQRMRISMTWRRAMSNPFANKNLIATYALPCLR